VSANLEREVPELDYLIVDSYGLSGFLIPARILPQLRFGNRGPVFIPQTIAKSGWFTGVAPDYVTILPRHRCGRACYAIQPT
jgi:hypothetical protein